MLACAELHPKSTPFRGFSADIIADGKTFRNPPNEQNCGLTKKDSKSTSNCPAEGLRINDGNHIIYVNGAYKNDETDIGKLMHDFRCTKSSDMFFDVLKNGMHYFKETEGGREKMCKAVEEYGKKQKLEGKIEGKIETAKNLAAMGMSVSVISQALDATEASVREWLDIKTA